MQESELVELRQRLVVLRGQIDRVLGLLNQDAEPPEPVPETEPDRVQLTWQQVAGAYAKRYRERRGLEWYYGAHVQAIEDLTAQINAQPGDPMENGKKLMDAFFADEFAKKTDFAPGLLAKKFGHYLCPTDAQDAEADGDRRRRSQEAQRRHEEAKARADADHARQVAERGLSGEDLGAIEELKQWLKRDG